MNLPLIAFPPILDTSSNDIIRDFFNPALGASVRYDRGGWQNLPPTAAGHGGWFIPHNCLSALAWMVADGTLDFKLVLPAALQAGAGGVS